MFSRNPLKSPKVLAGIWLLVACSAMGIFTARGFEPDAGGAPSPAWPEKSQVSHESNRYTLVVAVHPECPCSQATLEEFDKIVSTAGDRVKAKVLCVDYPELDEPVTESRIWKRAQQIQGITLVRDFQGTEAKQFDARISGEVRLYGPEGTLYFHGGITASRGHAGDNPGAASVLDIILGRAGEHPLRTTPVFGCTL